MHIVTFDGLWTVYVLVISINISSSKFPPRASAFIIALLGTIPQAFL